jgi:hypothetical protein
MVTGSAPSLPWLNKKIALVAISAVRATLFTHFELPFPYVERKAEMQTYYRGGASTVD